jgi:hypothetical protein
VDKKKYHNVITKSFLRENFESDFFNNEIVTYKILKEREKTCSRTEKKKFKYFVNFIGFTLNHDDENNLYFGSIVTNYYWLGNLSIYTKSGFNSNLVKDKKKEIEQLIDFAKQIAIGFYIFLLKCF